MSRLPRAAILLALVGAALLAVPAGATIDPGALFFSGNEKIYAVFLLDGQAYFGHVDDVPWSSSITLRDVYYFDDAHSATTDLPVALIKRGNEIHHPADGMSIRRDKVVAVERVSPDSPVAQAISAERALERAAVAK